MAVLLLLIVPMADEATIAQWNTEGLPNDRTSVENGTICVKAARCCTQQSPTTNAPHTTVAVFDRF